MRSTWTLALLLLAFAGCNGNQSCDDCDGSVSSDNDGTCEGCDTSAPAGPTATIVANVTIDGESVSSPVWAYEYELHVDPVYETESIEIGDLVGNGASGQPIGIPADMPLMVMAGDPDKLACDISDDPNFQMRFPLYYDADGNPWTYDVPMDSFTENMEVPVSIPLAIYLLGWFECTSSYTIWNDETEEYDIDSERDPIVYDPLLVKMHGTSIETGQLNDGDEIAEVGGGGTFSTSGSNLLFEPEPGQEYFSLEEGSSYITHTDFGFVFIWEEMYRSTVTCELVEAATCDDE